MAVNVAVSPVGASVMVSVVAAEPVVSVNVADVFDETDIEDMLAPVPPDRVNRPVAPSKLQTVFVPVAVIVGAPPMFPVAGEIVNEAVPTVSDGDTIPSMVMVNVPAPAPVVTARVAAVPLVWVQVPFVTVVVPVTLFWTETVDPLVQLVPVPVRVSSIEPEWLAGIVDGETVNPVGGAAAEMAAAKNAHSPEGDMVAVGDMFVV